MPSPKLAELQQTIGYTFDQLNLLEVALTHRSFGPENNERLEFLGDAILGCVIAQALYDKFPAASEGQMSRLRSTLVRGNTLAEMGKHFDLGAYMRLGPGEMKSGGHRRASIIADAVEAIIGAIYLDSNFSETQALILTWYEERMSELTLKAGSKDPKTRLQEYLQSRKLALPFYEIDRVVGEDHNQTFHVSCFVESLGEKTFGRAPSRRHAEQQAAGKALALMGLDDE